MELFKEAVEFFGGESSGAPDPNAGKPPAFEYPPSKPFTRHFTMPLPVKVCAVGQINLRATLSNVNYALVNQLGTGGEMEQLSALVNRLRTQVTLRPLLTDLKSYYVYGALIKMLSQWFYNTNVTFVSYFDAAALPVSALLYEYQNVVLLTALRLYTDINARDEWTAQTGPVLTQARLVLEELRACVRFAQCEPFQENAHTNRWLYQPSPSAIGNNNAAQETVSMLREDKAGVARHIEEVMGGAAHIEALALLVEANVNEVRATVWAERLDQEDEAEMEGRAHLVYDCFVPYARRVVDLYQRIEEHLTQCPSSRLLWYAKFQALYWTVRGELALAEYEADYYEAMREAEDSVQHGQSALKRVELLIHTLNTRHNKSAASIKMTGPLRAEYDSMLQRVKDLYEALHDSVAGAYGYNADLVALMTVGKVEEVPRKSDDYCQVAKAHLKEYLAQHDSDGSLERCFALLDELYKRDRTLGLTPPPSFAVPPQQQQQRSDAVSVGHLEERKLCYEWLLQHRTERDEIVLSRTETQALQNEVALIGAALAAHSQ